MRHTGRGRPSLYCSDACKHRAYRANRARKHVTPLALMRQDLRQVLETERIKQVVLEVFKEMGVFDFLEKLSFQPPEPQPAQLHLVKSPPNGKSEE